MFVHFVLAGRARGSAMRRQGRRLGGGLGGGLDGSWHAQAVSCATVLAAAKFSQLDPRPRARGKSSKTLRQIACEATHIYCGSARGHAQCLEAFTSCSKPYAKARAHQLTPIKMSSDNRCGGGVSGAGAPPLRHAPRRAVGADRRVAFELCLEPRYTPPRL